MSAVEFLQGRPQHDHPVRADQSNSSIEQRPDSLESSLLTLPFELRMKIYSYAFHGDRITVTADRDCLSVVVPTGSTNGPYQPHHNWLLNLKSPKLRRDARSAFVATAYWEFDCRRTLDTFIHKLIGLGELASVKHIQLSTFEHVDMDVPSPTTQTTPSLLGRFHNLRTVTFAPWQQAWSIDVPVREGSEQLSDANVLQKIHKTLLIKEGYEEVRSLLGAERDFTLFLVFTIRWLAQGKVLPYRWQIRVGFLMPSYSAGHSRVTGVASGSRSRNDRPELGTPL